ncbi:MAG: hypothetical protein ACKORG_01290 [Actinomycetota bacterium]
MTDPAPETPAEGTDPSPQPKRFLFLRRREAAAGTDAAAEPAATGADTPADADITPDRIRPGVLKRRRRQLTAQYEQGIFDLGGLAMELHARGLLAEDVMRRRAAEVADIRAQVDDLSAQLDQLRQERQDRRQAGRGGSIQCPACGFRSRSTANFCAACGAPLKADVVVVDGVVEVDQPTTVIVDEQVTTVIVDDDPQPTAAIPPQGKDGA